MYIVVEIDTNRRTFAPPNCKAKIFDSLACAEEYAKDCAVVYLNAGKKFAVFSGAAYFTGPHIPIPEVQCHPIVSHKE